MSLGPFVLPFRGDQYTFGINYKSPEEATNFDLSCVAFDVNGKLHDIVHARKPSALDGALVKAAEKSLLPASTVPVEGDDVLYMFPKMFERQVEVLVFVASAPAVPGRVHDLSSSSKLDFHVSYIDESGKPFDQTFDLAPLAQPQASAEGGKPQRTSSIIVAVMYLQAEGGWTLRDVGSAHPFDSPGLIIPEMKRTILDLKDKYGVTLDAADKLEITDGEKVPVTPQWQDQSLDEAAGGREVQAAKVTKLRVDLSWTFWPAPAPTEEGEEPPEEPALEFNLIMYNKDGEEVQSVSTNSREATGAKAGRPEPEEAEEDAEPEPEPEADEADEADEGAEPKEPPPPPPAPKVDPYEFKERDVAYLELAEIPPDVRTMVLVVSNYDPEAGFTRVRAVRARLQDVSAGEGEGQARCLADYGMLSKYGADKGVTQVVLLKLYKEYEDSAFNMFKAAGVDKPSAFVSQDPEDIKKALTAYFEANKAFKAKEAAALAAAEESGEEITTDLRPHAWRFRALGLCLGGDSLEAAEHDIKNAATFDGELAAGEARASATARVQFANNDTYFGAYAADVKHGPGVYAFASGAAYAGHYVGGKRAGHGVMVFPDGGTYVGEFGADKFEGQGQYRYPDGSVYTGGWAAGKKHGYGVYWDTSKGCLRGQWVAGVLKGQASYDQPAYRFDGEFVRGVPAGPGTFTLTSHRTLDLPCFAASHIQAPGGPTLELAAQYGIPAGSGDEPGVDEDGQPIEDGDKPPLPAFPKYEGLTFTAELLPASAADTAFPPSLGLIKAMHNGQGVLPVPLDECDVAGSGAVPVKAVPAFTVATGLVA